MLFEYISDSYWAITLGAWFILGIATPLFLLENGGRWRAGNWRPWVPVWLRILVVVGISLPFLPFLILVLLLWLALVFTIGLFARVIELFAKVFSATRR